MSIIKSLRLHETKCLKKFSLCALTLLDTHTQTKRANAHEAPKKEKKKKKNFLICSHVYLPYIFFFLKKINV